MRISLIKLIANRKISYEQFLHEADMPKRSFDRHLGKLKKREIIRKEKGNYFLNKNIENKLLLMLIDIAKR